MEGRAGPGLPNVLSGAAQLLIGPTQYLTRQRLPIACVKLFLAVFIGHLLSCVSFSSFLLAIGGMLAHNSENVWCLTCHPVWQAAASLIGWGETLLMVLRRECRCLSQQIIATAMPRSVGGGEIRLH